MDVQLPIIEEEFAIENWRAEGRVDAEELSALSAYGRKHAQERSKLQWKIADWLLRGKENGLNNAQRLKAEVADIHREMPISTIWDYLRVAERFRDHSRRRESLFFSHHKEVAVDEFDDVMQDRLLEQAERRNLSVMKLRSRANAEKKTAKKKRLGKVKFVRIPVGPETAKILKQLGYIRDQRPEQILSAIVTKYFSENLEAITKEVEAWKADIRETTRQARTIRKADKAKLEALRVERKRFQDYFFDLRNRTGQPVPQFIKGYLEKECGHARWLEIPLCVLEDVIAKAKEAGDDPHVQVKRLQTLSWSEPQRQETTRS